MFIGTLPQGRATCVRRRYVGVKFSDCAALTRLKGDLRAKATVHVSPDASYVASR